MDSLQKHIDSLVASNPTLLKSAKITLVSPNQNEIVSNQTSGSTSTGDQLTFSAPVEVAGQKWTLLLVVSKTNFDLASDSILKRNSELLAKIKTVSDAITVKIDSTSKILTAEKSKLHKLSATSAKYRSILLFFAAILIAWGIAYCTKKSFTKQENWCHQILHSIPFPLIIVNQQLIPLFRNRVAEKEKFQVSNQAFQSLGHRTSGTNRETRDNAIYDVYCERFCDDHQKQLGSIQIFSDVTAKIICDKQNQLLASVLPKVHSDMNNANQANLSLQHGFEQSTGHLDAAIQTIDRTKELTQLNEHDAQEANLLTKDALGAATKGQNQMHEMIASMNHICETSTQMQKVIKTIDDIAFQTNLLALNAAVEAARAGSHGKGFAVVAEEVRSLATRSAKAAKETADLIESSNTQILGGADIANQTAAALDEISKMVEGASQLVAQITTTSAEQSANVVNVATSLREVEVLSQQNNSTIERAEIALRELAESMESLAQQRR
ncbi:MAG: methyl-accepting chemotaxis protein [Thermoguttaceae bacterium]